MRARTWSVKLPVAVTFDACVSQDASSGEVAVEMAWDRLERVQVAFLQALADEGFHLVGGRAGRLLFDCQNGVMEEAEAS